MNDSPVNVENEFQYKEFKIKIFLLYKKPTKLEATRNEQKWKVSDTKHNITDSPSEMIRSKIKNNTDIWI